MNNSDADIKTVNKIIDKLGELPAAPAIISKAIKLTSDLNSDISDISNSILADQTLTAKVISMSNSPLYGRAKKVSSLKEAIRVMGFNQLKSIIITASTFSIFRSGAHAKIAQILWEHSFATALGARLIVQKYGGLDMEDAYLCGLLHDIGKLALLKTAPNVYEEIIEKVRHNNLPFIQVEAKELGFNHVNVGHVLLTRWQFPTNLISQISMHHSSNPNKKEHSISLGRVVAIANSIAKYIGADFYEPYRACDDSVVFVGKKSIEIDDLISLRTDTEEHFNSEMNSLCK